MSNDTEQFGGCKTDVRSRCRLSASAEEVWALVGDFANPQAWLPGIREVTVQEDGMRVCDTQFGRFREQLIRIGPTSCEYRILDGPLPVRDYEAALTALPSARAASCLLTWHSSFRVARSTEVDAARRLVARIYNAGLRALQVRYGSEDPDPLFSTNEFSNVPFHRFLTISS